MSTLVTRAKRICRGPPFLEALPNKPSARSGVVVFKQSHT